MTDATKKLKAGKIIRCVWVYMSVYIILYYIFTYIYGPVRFKLRFLIMKPGTKPKYPVLIFLEPEPIHLTIEPIQIGRFGPVGPVSRFFRFSCTPLLTIGCNKFVSVVQSAIHGLDYLIL